MKKSSKQRQVHQQLASVQVETMHTNNTKIVSDGSGKEGVPKIGEQSSNINWRFMVLDVTDKLAHAAALALGLVLALLPVVPSVFGESASSAGDVVGDDGGSYEEELTQPSAWDNSHKLSFDSTWQQESPPPSPTTALLAALGCNEATLQSPVSPSTLASLDDDNKNHNNSPLPVSEEHFYAVATYENGTSTIECDLCDESSPTLEVHSKHFQCFHKKPSTQLTSVSPLSTASMHRGATAAAPEFSSPLPSILPALPPAAATSMLRQHFQHCNNTPSQEGCASVAPHNCVSPTPLQRYLASFSVQHSLATPLKPTASQLQHQITVNQSTERSSLTRAQQQQQSHEIRKCYNCKQPAASQRKRCEDCLRKNRESNVAFRSKKNLAQQQPDKIRECVRCKRPAAPERKRCENCLEKSKVAGAIYRSKKRSTGQTLGRKSIGHRESISSAQQQLQSHQIIKCRKCKQPAVFMRAKCEKCLEKARSRTSSYRLNKRLAESPQHLSNKICKRSGCSSIADPGFKRCSYHRQQPLLARKEKPGTICSRPNCNEPPAPGWKQCQGCKEARRGYKKTLKEASASVAR